MNDKKLREYIQKKIKLEMSKNKNLTKEGIVDSVFNHIENILKKSNNKRYRADLEDIASKSPEARKAVEKHIDKMNNLEKDAAEAMALIDKY
jgi:DNA topoisomerase VI subunit B